MCQLRNNTLLRDEKVSIALIIHMHINKYTKTIIEFIYEQFYGVNNSKKAVIFESKAILMGLNGRLFWPVNNSNQKTLILWREIQFCRYIKGHFGHILLQKL